MKLNLCSKLTLAILLGTVFSGSFALATGGETSGGGNTVNHQLIDTMRIDPTHLRGWQDGLVPMLKKVQERLPEFAEDLARSTPGKVWYLIPRKLTELPPDVTGLHFSSDQIILQSDQEVWIDQTGYAALSAKTKKAILLHELVRGLAEDGNISVEVCEEHKTKEKADALQDCGSRPPSAPYSTFMTWLSCVKPRGYFDTTECGSGVTDADIRAVTSFLLMEPMPSPAAIRTELEARGFGLYFTTDEQDEARRKANAGAKLIVQRAEQGFTKIEDFTAMADLLDEVEPKPSDRWYGLVQERSIYATYLVGHMPKDFAFPARLGEDKSFYGFLHDLEFIKKLASDAASCLTNQGDRGNCTIKGEAQTLSLYGVKFGIHILPDSNHAIRLRTLIFFDTLLH